MGRSFLPFRHSPAYLHASKFLTLNSIPPPTTSRPWAVSIVTHHCKPGFESFRETVLQPLRGDAGGLWPVRMKNSPGPPAQLPDVAPGPSALQPPAVAPDYHSLYTGPLAPAPDNCRTVTHRRKLRPEARRQIVLRMRQSFSAASMIASPLWMTASRLRRSILMSLSIIMRFSAALCRS